MQDRGHGVPVSAVGTELMLRRLAGMTVTDTAVRALQTAQWVF